MWSECWLLPPHFCAPSDYVVVTLFACFWCWAYLGSDISPSRGVCWRREMCTTRVLRAVGFVSLLARSLLLFSEVGDTGKEVAA